MGASRPAHLRACVSHDRCVGVGMCTQLAPGAFRLNDAGQAEFQPDGAFSIEDLHEAADGCPMSAITVEDDPGSNA